MRISHRYLIMLVALSVMVVGLAIPAHAGPEGTLFSRINSSRSANGLAPLESYWDLTDDARAHSGRMMDRGSIYHNPSLGSVTSVWQALGENVGMGIDLNAMHDAFMNSPGHRANILGNYNYVGVGVKTDASGVSWVTVVFMRADPGLNGGGTTTTVPPTTTTTTAPPVTTSTTAPPAPTPTPTPGVTPTTKPAPKPAATTPTTSPAATTTQPPATTTTLVSADDVATAVTTQEQLKPSPSHLVIGWQIFKL
ncbi:MAG: CAP domain-containing protein [Actinomycetia bacterium]|nr:CAP domain-containing protein [Actinomycetes bacterium]